MAHPVKPGEGEIDATPGLAGGPGPTPPGVDDGTVSPRRAEPEHTVAPPGSAAEQQAEGEAAERSAAVRRADVPGLAGEREGRGAEGNPERPDEDAESRTRR